jgi:hypothetical protein
MYLLRVVTRMGRFMGSHATKKLTISAHFDRTLFRYGNSTPICKLRIGETYVSNHNRVLIGNIVGNVDST